MAVSLALQEALMDVINMYNKEMCVHAYVQGVLE